ncbi:leukocyte immunoglobulin-like receptor subfamily A member 5 isoform X2 [Rhinolophus sinicus]|uniref:leukocyte immunoglobulin-like receptor subfamily A member 5 isoform X2 n=1 Tax=Rhinolophus sinicus TaxID=89399 RepID=UPI003D7998A9
MMSTLVSTMSVSPTQDEGDVKCLQLGVKQRPSHYFLQCLCNAEKFAFHKSSVAEADRPLGPRIMFTVLPSLLYLGNLPPPHIIAQPTSKVLSKDTVTIQCHSPEAEAYNIYKVEGPKPMDRSMLPLPKKTYTLRIQEMTPDQAGLYRCVYQSGVQWSQPSDPLQLVMTGAYDKPSLTSITGTVVASGDNVKLQCFSKIGFDVFILIKEGGVHTTQNLSSTLQDSAHQAIFHLDHVTSTQMGTYRCYGAFHNDLYVWSHSSNQLQLVAKKAPDDPDPTEPRCCTEAPDYSIPTVPRRPHAPSHDQVEKCQHFLTGFPVTIALLLLLLLFFFILRHFKAKHKATRIDRHPEAAEPTDRQASEDPKEVTYSQITCRVPTQGTAGTPSFLPRHTQISEYATLALR